MRRSIPLLTLVLVLAGCAQEGAPPSPTPTAASPSSPSPSPSSPSPSPVAIDIQGFVFAGGARTVPVGTVVTWTNRDADPHTATADGGAFDTGILSSGQSASHTFSAAGTFPYHCAVHPSMTSTITVA